MKEIIVKIRRNPGGFSYSVTDTGGGFETTTEGLAKRISDLIIEGTRSLEKTDEQVQS